jgi:hypothetical protein
MDVDKTDINNEPINLVKIGEAVKTLCYKDVTLILLLNPINIRDILTIEVNL